MATDFGESFTSHLLGLRDELVVEQLDIAFLGLGAGRGGGRGGRGLLLLLAGLRLLVGAHLRVDGEFAELVAGADARGPQRERFALGLQVDQRLAVDHERHALAEVRRTLEAEQVLCLHVQEALRGLVQVAAGEARALARERRQLPGRLARVDEEAESALELVIGRAAAGHQLRRVHRQQVEAVSRTPQQVARDAVARLEQRVRVALLHLFAGALEVRHLVLHFEAGQHVHVDAELAAARVDDVRVAEATRRHDAELVGDGRLAERAEVWREATEHEAVEVRAHTPDLERAAELVAAADAALSCEHTRFAHCCIRISFYDYTHSHTKIPNTIPVLSIVLSTKY